MNRARPENLLPSHHLSTQWFRNTYLLKSDLREFQTQDENTFGLVSNTEHKQTNSSSFLPLLSLYFWCWCYHLLATSGRKKHFISFCFLFTQGPCCKGNCCQILACQRQTILKCMTEGRLNHILDVLRSQQTLSRMDYETITSYPTVTGRARALLDTCLCLGERAAQAVVTVLSVNKCSPLGQVIHCPDCPSKVNRLLLWLIFLQSVVCIWALVICDGKDTR